MIQASLAVLAGLSVNLILQFGLAAGSGVGFGEDETKRRVIPYFPLALLFIAVLALWTFYYLLAPLWGGFLEYFLFFPLSALSCTGLEALGRRFLPQIKAAGLPPVQTAYGGLVPAALILTTRLALNFADALVLSFSFALGCLLCFLILAEVRRRSALEQVPRFLRGAPLALISMGLLSLATGAVALVFSVSLRTH